MSIPDATAPVGPGVVLGGRYRLIGQVARGGMASVWEGYDDVLARSVAVKILHPHLAADRLFLERFRREAISAARLSHPNVVATFDAGSTPDGTAFIVMELVRGRTLRAFCSDRGPLPAFVTVGIAMQIADALSHAHAAGLVHRYIKPANVLVCDAGPDPTTRSPGSMPRIKVTDFGIAKAAEGLGLDLTRTGMVLGTPRYLSPEQIEGREPDARADLYALGVVLFEMLSGQPPFPGPTDVAMAIQHLNTAPARVGQITPGIPPALDALVAALLAKRPDDRPASATAVYQTLAEIDLRTTGAPVAPPLPPAQQPTSSMRPLYPVPPRTPPLPVTPAAGTTRAMPSPPAVASTSVLWRGADRTARQQPGPDRTARQPAPADPPPPAARRRSPGHPNWTGRMVAALVVAALVVIVVVLSGQGDSNHGTPGAAANGSTGQSAPVRIQDVSVFHLERDADNAATVGRTFDGNPATVWYTDHYFGPNFAGLRHGLGLAITLSSRHVLHSLTVTSPTLGWTAEVFVANGVPNPPSLSAWGAPVDDKTSVSTTTVFSLGGRAAGTVLLWLTDLGPTNRTGINELSVS